MPLYKITAFFHDEVGNYGWSFSSYRIEADVADVVSALDTFLADLMVPTSLSVYLDGCAVADQAGGVPSRFVPSTAFTNNHGTAGGRPYPIADGLMWEGYGGAVNKGRSDWLFHGISQAFSASFNQWDLTLADLIALNAAAVLYFLQFRSVISPVKGYPVVAPPAAFNTWRLNPFIRLRRVGRPLSRGGQGLRSRG